MSCQSVCRCVSVCRSGDKGCWSLAPGAGRRGRAARAIRLLDRLIDRAMGPQGKGHGPILRLCFPGVFDSIHLSIQYAPFLACAGSL